MGNWASISAELATIDAPERFDVLRRRKLTELSRITGRNVVLYAVDVHSSNSVKAQFIGPLTLISLADKDGFDEVTRNLAGPDLDVILHTPGGSAEATESVVELLRARFDHIRFIVPAMAKSAGTIMAMAGDQLLMDERSELGPTDPQMFVVRNQQQVLAPAQAIKDQFELAQKDINGDPNRLPGWVPILQQYGPSLLAECNNHMQLAQDLVAKWLEKYMFANDEDGSTKAKRVAEYLANHNNFGSHARRVGIDKLQELGVNILDMRKDKAIRDAVWDVYLATRLTFDGTGAVKVVENNQAEAFVLSVNVQMQVQDSPSNQPPQPPPHQPAPLGPRTKPPRGKRR